ncbi:hypothetical protein CDAR_73111 [Caerostris darwini]|uniref:Uncharacterized protein n=1 Tax=Caerostris darwini TaxID=1538125 RepID=A0AAV4VYA3_9ARAC|nr:hypothetical protein CDAR_73111 [Caerostris darwini]
MEKLNRRALLVLVLCVFLTVAVETKDNEKKEGGEEQCKKIAASLVIRWFFRFKSRAFSLSVVEVGAVLGHFCVSHLFGLYTHPSAHIHTCVLMLISHKHSTAHIHSYTVLRVSTYTFLRSDPHVRSFSDIPRAFFCT